MTIDDQPLNGSKTHPLSEHAKAALKLLESGPIPPFEINPGVLNRLQRSGFIEYLQLPSPYASHKGKRINHVQLTQAGIDFQSGKIADPHG